MAIFIIQVPMVPMFSRSIRVSDLPLLLQCFLGVKRCVVFAAPQAPEAWI
jgi:hypothetical protein